MLRHVRNYEKGFAEYFRVERAFAFWKGRVALYAILKALGVGDGDEVILPGYTCVMDVNPVKYLGARPVFVDIEPNTYNMNVELLEEAITAQTRVIIAQHTYGYPAEMDAIMEIAQSHGIDVIEDCCLAPGSRYKGKLVGTMGIASYFSSQWNKTYTTGLGGMALCHNRELADKIQQFCNDELKDAAFSKAVLLSMQRMVYRAVIYPRTTMTARRLFRWLITKGIVIGSSSSQEKTTTAIPQGFFTAMSSGQAKAGLAQLRCIEENFAHRRKMAKLYDSLLREKKWPVTEVPDYTEPVLVRYPVRITEKWQAIKEAVSCGIELGTWFESPLHPKETKVDLYDYKWGSCPEAERAAGEVVNLPLHPRTSEKTIRRMVEFITRYQFA